MSQITSRFLPEVKRLAQAANATFARARTLSDSMDGAELAGVSAWVTQLGELLRRLYGEKSEQVKAYQRAIATPHFYDLHSNWNQHLAILIGLTSAAVHDLENGLLDDIKSLVQADVFSDFLEMGEHLLEEGYKDAASVIIGSVLEDTLRKLAESNSVALVTVAGKPLTMEPLNIELAGAQVYSKLVQKQITTWAHVRNKAAHGHYAEYNKEQVQMMLQFVQSFCAEHLR
jgi:hypothetical protein